MVLLSVTRRSPSTSIHCGSSDRTSPAIYGSGAFRTPGRPPNHTRKTRPKRYPSSSSRSSGRRTTWVLARPEAAITKAFETHLGLPDAVSIHDVFFSSGGDSLLGAMVISDLRLDPETAGLTMRDLYECRTVKALAQRLGSGAEEDVLLTAFTPPEANVWSTHLAIIAVLAIMLSVTSTLAYVLGFVLLPWMLSNFSLGPICSPCPCWASWLEYCPSP